MTLNIRRIVTGHDAEGKARVVVDEIASNIVSRRPGHDSVVAWAEGATPPDLSRHDDIAQDLNTTTLPNGTVFRIISYGPGVAPRWHRTTSVDYATVLSGAIDMELDGGETVSLRAGDVIVQRGTMHNWVNKGTEPCIIAFVLVSAELPEGLAASG